ncbi:alpha-1,2-mannosidase [Niastella vici]|uniref:Alpha-1,2-mannosidase n=1 Tax=Niastella vici TaxID=1703345 RepID=A0A1V9G087_9BACT|nr:GH92 family glycosyl hydrolase [Niastella vici]OQP63906.1 alpha-1,2-mannosidase [Niastella vici]
MKINGLFLALMCVTATINAQIQQPADYVNPFIGASTSIEKAGASHGLGKTFPGATTPFGLVQVSANTITGGDNGSGYSYEHTTIEGFACTQMSGVGWYGDLGNFLVMPTTGPLHTAAGKPGEPGSGYRSRYDKQSEKARAGYYGVRLTDYDIRAELTAAPHSAVMRFTFPAHQQSRLQIDLARRVGGTSVLQYVKVVNENTITGYMKCTPEGGGWGNGDGKGDYTVYFYTKFSKPLQHYGVWSADIPDGLRRKRENIESDSYQQRIAKAEVLPGVREKEGKHLGFFTEFATTANEAVTMSTGISLVSMEGAQKNWQAEIGNKSFDDVCRLAHEEWNKALGKITVTGGSDNDKTIFYTALYHTMIDPRSMADVDGKYPGADGQIHSSTLFTKRTIFSGWDVFRSQMPLQTIINPRVVNDMINSLVELADQSGKHYLERWEFFNAYSGCMIGNPAIVMITDAYAKGIKQFNTQKALAYAINTSERFGTGDKGYCAGGSSVSNTLEYAFSEWSLSKLAGMLGNNAVKEKYEMRSRSWQNIFDTTVQWFRPRNNDGSWAAWPANGRLEQSYGCVESNLYQQGWFVPHDVTGMIKYMGGREKVLNDLLHFFDSVPANMLWNNYYNHANEPVHHVPFLFNWLGAPWYTQQWTRAICARAYHNSVEGLVGNEDVGQMSAWYVLAASGLHPVCPGNTRYEITSPVFDKITIRPGMGKLFTIIAKHNSKHNLYIQRATLNGKPWSNCFIDHAQIIAGGVLELEMGSVPNQEWGRGAVN